MGALRVAFTALICVSVLLPSAWSAEEISYRYDTPDTSTPTPGPTDPNAPSS